MDRRTLWTIAAMTFTRTFDLDEASVAMGFYGLASAGAAPAETAISTLATALAPTARIISNREFAATYNGILIGCIS